MALIKICNRIIEYSFYALFLLVPLAFTSATSELFELNKMWLTWGLTIIIVASWLIKMVLQRRILFQKTPLDIPIALFLLSQIISTIFSLDSHVSLWGYYSRFNGGLLSIISYILLYYAFLSNSPTLAKVQRLMTISLVSGLIVAFWGLPSHFGYDPTCLLFRGTLDVSCWTADFMPKIRIFSTLGQPDWLAAYLAILIPIAIVFAIQKTQNTQKSGNSDSQTIRLSDNLIHRVFRVFQKPKFYLLLVTLFYVDLLFTGARSGVLGVWISLIFFAALYYWANGKPKLSISFEKLKSPLAVLIFGFLIITFVIGTPISQLHRFTLEGIGSVFQKAQVQKNDNKNLPQEAEKIPAQPHEPGGTESGDIRLNVWTGAINAWRANPIFGTGVETFAFAYYKYKPAEHNLTSEWNFLYNKAHNEYLNYLATTGLFGLATYLFMVGSFIFMSFKYLNPKSEAPNPKQYRNSNDKNTNLFRAPSFDIRILTLALLAGYVSILITNFFGFSVVITNIYLFMIPAFVFILAGMLPRNESGIPTSSQAAGLRGASKDYESRNLYQWLFIFCIILASLFMILKLFRFWQADIAYALGYNLDRAGEYQNAYPHLHKAVELRGSELVFKDELSINDAIIAAALLAQQPSDDQKEQTISVAASLTQEAINTSNEIVSKSSNNAVFWKTRVRLFYTLSQIDSRYLPKALEGIEKASILAPNDANIWYNLGVLYGQNNNIKKGIEALEKTIQLKPNYRDAHYALGLYYRTTSLDSTGKVVTDSALQKKAISQMQYILDHLNPNDSGALESITNWSK